MKSKRPYKISTGPGEFTLSPRVRRTKSRTHAVEEFNRMVDQGVITGITTKEGRVAGAKHKPPNMTPTQFHTIRQVVRISQEPASRKNAPFRSKEDKINDASYHSLVRHGLQGGFKAYHPTLELASLEGKDVGEYVRLAEAANHQTYPALHKVAQMTPAQIKKNLRVQLRYFQAFMKKRKMKELPIAKDAGLYDYTEVTIKLKPNGDVEKEVRGFGKPGDGSVVQIMTKIILHNNGRISTEKRYY
ncbi:MAG: hypothetical protein NUV67_02545 [archaeon]|nr:hypothetical protein [archaeon]